ncbi:hypothetical protein CHARACLAT_031956 [Characodon lateralis]|uniref:Reverse transcriptase n=1 Tax=Characodon lateralis TaxID=208331 RepID=A0ABU7CWD7_9TELE|nr:hypothetical protein [Characodon lateralis]
MVEKSLFVCMEDWGNNGGVADRDGGQNVKEGSQWSSPKHLVWLFLEYRVFYNQIKSTFYAQSQPVSQCKFHSTKLGSLSPILFVVFMDRILRHMLREGCLVWEPQDFYFVTGQGTQSSRERSE